MAKVLIVDDDKNYVSALASIIQRNGFEVDVASLCRIANEKVATHEHDLVFVDMILPDGNGMDVVRDAPENYPGRFYIMTGYPSVDTAVHALRGRAEDYLIKPVTTRKIDDVLARYHAEQQTTNQPRHNGRGKNKSTKELAIAKPSIRTDKQGLEDSGSEIIGDSAPVRKLRHDIDRLASSTSALLLQGEKGTGKKLIAEKIHSLGNPRGELHTFDCSAICKEQISAELFGYEKIDSKGIHHQHPGIFERASGGTILFEKITEIPVNTQTILLGTLQSGRYSRVGAPHKSLELNVRIFTTTSSDLIEAVKEGKLREDLYFLLAETPILVPALRNRGKDILVFAGHFLDHLNHSYRNSKILDESGRLALMNYSWPGNITELKHAIHRAFLLSDDVLDFSQIAELSGNDTGKVNSSPYLGSSIADMEKKLILETLTHYDNNKPRAAEVLGISLKTLYNRLNRYNRPSHGRTAKPELH